MRVCLVYDCLYPHTVGGGERWYRGLAERLDAAGHEVFYLTLRQWDRGVDPAFGDVEVRVVGPRMALYDAAGRRRILPPLVFGAGVLWHLLRHGRRYDVVQCAAFPYFSLLGAALARPRGRYGLVVDWFEVWSDSYWREYLGRLGPVGSLVQRLCARVPQRALCLSRLHASRLRSIGLRGPVEILRGLWAGTTARTRPLPAGEEVVFAGRLIPEKRAEALVGAVAAARNERPALRATIYGDGPAMAVVAAEVERLDAASFVSLPGFVEAAELERALRSALCLLLPSRREGYGLVVVEAASMGVPSVVVAGPDNAAVELIEEGVNGFVAASAEPEAVARAIGAVAAGGPELRERTADWFAAHARELSLEGSFARVLEAYGSGAVAPAGSAPSARR